MRNAPAARLQRRPSFISELYCCYQRLSASRGTESLAPQYSGERWAWLGRYTCSSWRDACECKLPSPQFEDRLFHALLPFAAYATLVGSAYAARSNVGGALFGVGASALLLLFIGIHNAWDAVTYHLFVRKQGQRPAERHHSRNARNSVKSGEGHSS